MKEIDWLKSIDDGGPATPRVDVAARVMQELQARAVDDRDVVFPAAAGAALLAAAVALLLAAPWRSDHAEPLQGFQQVLEVAIQ